MNRLEVLAALEAALHPESEPYKKALQKHQGLAPHQAAQARAMDLAEPVAAVLAGQPEYLRCPHMMLQSGGVRIGFQPNRAGYLLVFRGMNANADDAVNWLADLVENSRASGLHVIPIWQLAVESAVPLADDVRLIPFSMLPPSSQKLWLEAPLEEHHLFSWAIPSSLRMQQPTAAITARKVIDPLFVDADAEFQADPDPIPDLLDDVGLCLSTIGPHPLLGAVRWFQFDDPELNVAAGSAITPTLLEIQPHWLPLPMALDADAAQRLVPKFLAMRRELRNRVRISLQRLVQAMLRREPGDTAADLSIALEALLTDQPGEHTWKVSTRSAVLTGGDLQSKLSKRNVIAAAYRMRSSLVHSGVASNLIEVSGRGKIPASTVCNEASVICAAALRTIIERGAISRWPEFDIWGGCAGWPQPGGV